MAFKKLAVFSLVLSSSSMLGLAYFYSIQEKNYEQTQRQFQDLEKKYATSTMNQAQELAQLKQMKPKPQTNTNMLYLLEQAYWQVNVFNQDRLASRLLKTARRLAKTQENLSLEQALNQDLQQIKQQKLSNTSDLVQQIYQMQASLEALKLQVQFPISKHETKEDKISQLFKPYLQIERYQSKQAKIFPPSQQEQSRANGRIICQELAYAAITHQAKLYTILWQELAAQIAQLPEQADLKHALEQLRQARISHEQALVLHSLELYHQQDAK